MYKKELHTAIAAVREAIALAEKVSSNLTSQGALIKTDFSPVTLADYGVQAIIHRRLARDFPNDLIVAEEDTDDLEKAENSALTERLLTLLQEVAGPWTREEMLAHIGRGRHDGGAAGRFWTLDPIDGTKGFIRGDQYALALALIENGRPVLGVLGCPRLLLPNDEGSETCLGWICWADGNQSVAESLDGKVKRPMMTSAIRDARELRMCESVEAGHSAHDVSSEIATELGVYRSSVRMDSQAKYAVVADGMADAYLRLPTKADYREKIWDHAAGAFIVETAGGTVTDVLGTPLDFSQGRTLKNNRGVIATTSGIHAAVTKVVKKHFE